ncbi:alpha/beta hydrolase family protein [uncultured Chitinophaga sp.]|jgi:Predicted esterase|uniref:alpha/beta hydrolase n=1 Tax=uncultured Chitinophaga sp. TaxID=339340 RepID=UPI002639820F|nr:alpha/beta hydrolase family protein [uncultured Chitinophaga sp.]
MKNTLLLFTFLLVSFSATYAAKVDTIQIYSQAMHKPVKCVVVIPDTYNRKKGLQFPVIYLLHGYSGNYADWVRKAPGLPALADTYQCMIVCPDGGFGSWYLDSPVDSAWKYETYVGKEIPAYIDSHYRTLADRQHRAITGLSMGGHGALFLAIRHSDTFGAAGSMSGGVDIRPFPKNWDLSKRLGSIEEHPEHWKEYAVVTQAEQLKDGVLSLIIDCGVKDFFIDVNRSLHQQLLQQGIAHDYTERPGEHNWAYWSNAVEYQALFFHNFFERSKDK